MFNIWLSFSLVIKCNDESDGANRFFTINIFHDNPNNDNHNDKKRDIEHDVRLHIEDIEKDCKCIFSNNVSLTIRVSSELSNINKQLHVVLSQHICEACGQTIPAVKDTPGPSNRN